MLRLLRLILAAAAVTWLAGCTNVVDKLPADLGGLPSGAPARPAQPYAYPAVHDVPPPRVEPAMTVEQQQKVEDDLRAARDRQERAQDKGSSNPKTKPKTKPKATSEN